MIRLSACLAAFTMLLLLWHECGEDVGVFCYRMGAGAFANVRSRSLVPVPVRNSVLSATRNNAECSTPSFTSSARSIVPKDLRS